MKFQYKNKRNAYYWSFFLMKSINLGAVDSN